MPCISQFFGIVIYMYYNDHAPPHFHAEYAGSEALYEIRTLNVYAGSLPRRAHNLVIEWADLNRSELMADWERARSGEPLVSIDPLEMKLVRAKSVEPIREFLVKVTFSNGETREIDFEPYMRGRIFKDIRENSKTFEAMKIDSRMGAIVWDNGADIDPDVLYHGLKPAWSEESELELSN